MHVIAAKAVALGEALQPEFKRYAGQVIENAQAMCQQLAQRGLTLLTGGTDCHLGIIDLRPQGLTGAQVEYFLELAGSRSIKTCCGRSTAAVDYLRDSHWQRSLRHPRNECR